MIGYLISAALGLMLGVLLACRLSAWCREALEWDEADAARQMERIVDMERRCGALAGWLEHLETLADGGDWSLANLVLACFGCNNRRGATPLNLWIKRLAAGRKESHCA